MCAPTVKVLTANVAVPLVSVTGIPGVPSTVKVTAPVALVGATLAVNVTDWPKVEGLPLDARVAAVVAAVTVILVCAPVTDATIVSVAVIV